MVPVWMYHQTLGYLVSKVGNVSCQSHHFVILLISSSRKTTLFSLFGPFCTSVLQYMCVCVKLRDTLSE